MGSRCTVQSIRAMLLALRRRRRRHPRKGRAQARSICRLRVHRITLMYETLSHRYSVKLGGPWLGAASPPLTRGCSTARQCSSRGSVGSKLSPTFTLTYTIPTCDTHYTHIGWPPMRVPHTARLRRLCGWQELGALLRRKDGTSTARASTASTSRPSSRRTVVPDTLRRQNRHYEERSLEGFQHIDD